ncbi:DUF3108 domain-containing protein [bacterium]|nr:DUF3108 domain-containing protein [candidate division CSSED10-310 bacterium]
MIASKKIGHRGSGSRGIIVHQGSKKCFGIGSGLQWRMILLLMICGFFYPVSAAGPDRVFNVENNIPSVVDSRDTKKERVFSDTKEEADIPMFMNEDPFFTWSEFDRSIENPIFRYGESLTYVVSWMGINAGTITITLDVDASSNGKPALKMVVTGSTNKTFSMFFKVKDIITSYMDPVTFNSIHYIKDIREGKYRKVQETFYDSENRIARVKEKEYILPPNSKDPIACIFALRRYRPDEDTIIRMNSNSEGKDNFPVEIAFLDHSVVTLGDGVTREVLIGKPLPTWEGRVFEKKRSTVVMWLSHDEYVVPMRLETKVRIGTLKAELIQRSGPGWTMNLEKD